jgi:presenilin-like A22 family membrane protease
VVGAKTIRGLRGDGRDEYWASLDLGATTLAGVVLITVVIAMSMWEWAHGRSGSPYSELGAIAGIAYLVALVALRLRR